MTILDQIVADKLAQVAEAVRRTPQHDLKSMICETPWEPRRFETRLRAPGPLGVNVIAEIKRASPSKGDICPGLDAALCAWQYQAGGAAAISVLTDGPYFKGSLNDLRQARASVELPILCKEFIISDYQIYEARAAGADAVLLIVRILSARQLKDYMALAHSLEMGTLVEIHTTQDYEIAHDAGCSLIGINNRNLATFDTDVGTAIHVVNRFEPGEVPVAASGIASRQDIERNLKQGIFNFLIGESLVRAPDREAFLRNLIFGAFSP